VKKSLMFLLVLFTVALLSSVALATPVSVTYVGYGPFETANIKYSKDGTSKTISGVVAGYYNIKIAGIDGWNPGDIFKSFCVDVFDNVPPINSANTGYELVSLDEVPKQNAGPMGAVRATRLKKLWANYYSTTFVAQYAAAFQLAVWEIVYDDDLNLTNGNFQVTYAQDATKAQANTWLTGLDNLTIAANKPNISAVTSNTYQDFVAPSPVPEPASIFLFGTSLLGLFVASRKRLLSKKS
jgi:hypothetical protein